MMMYIIHRKDDCGLRKLLKKNYSTCNLYYCTVSFKIIHSLLYRVGRILLKETIRKSKEKKDILKSYPKQKVSS